MQHDGDGDLEVGDFIEVPIQAVLSERLKAARENAGISQEALADRSGLHRTYIGSVERGERNVTLSSLFRFTEVLGVKLAALLRGFEEDVAAWTPPADSDLHLAVALARARKTAGMSMADAAKKGGLSKWRLASLERGTKSPSYKELQALADAYNVKLSSLLAEAGR